MVAIHPGSPHSGRHLVRVFPYQVPTNNNWEPQDRDQFSTFNQEPIIWRSPPDLATSGAMEQTVPEIRVSTAVETKSPDIASPAKQSKDTPRSGPVIVESPPHNTLERGNSEESTGSDLVMKEDSFMKELQPSVKSEVAGGSPLPTLLDLESIFGRRMNKVRT
eukprot:sb/3472688/